MNPVWYRDTQIDLSCHLVCKNIFVLLHLKEKFFMFKLNQVFHLMYSLTKSSL